MGNLLRLHCYALFLLTAACGDDASAPDRGDGGSQPATGGNAGGPGGNGGGSGGAGGGTASGGGPASGGAGGAPAGQHCSPGTLLDDPVDTYGFRGKMTNCQDYQWGDGGIPWDNTAPRSIELTTPMVAGQAYSFSLEAVSPIPETELWGSEVECGFASELLWAGDVERGIFCVEFTPTSNHAFIIMEWRGPGGTHGDVGLCPGAACSP
jgi:hypothetical protein